MFPSRQIQRTVAGTGTVLSGKNHIVKALVLQKGLGKHHDVIGKRQNSESHSSIRKDRTVKVTVLSGKDRMAK